ncbi:MAG TPA: DUF2079 domain-containing protein [bacterium]|nr:DUF2079 domain-containing protein [bacterium]
MKYFLIFSLLLIFIFGVFYNYSHYYNKLDYTVDSGFFSNLINNTINGDYFYTSFYHWAEVKNVVFNSLGENSYFTATFAAPLFMFFSSPVMLNIFQQFFLLAAVYLIFKISLSLLNNKFISFILAILILSNNHFQYLFIYDYHPEIFSFFSILLIFFFFINKKFKLAVLFVIVSALNKATLLPTLAFLVLYFFVKSKFKSFLALFVFILIYFFILNYYFFPLFRNESNNIKNEFLARYDRILDNNNDEFIYSVLKNPLKILRLISGKESGNYLKDHYLNFGFLPFFNSLNYTVFPTFLINSLSSSIHQKSIYYQYNPDMLAVSVLSFILTLSFFLKTIRKKSFIAGLIIIILFINIANNYKDGPFTTSSAPYQKFEPVKLFPEFLNKINEIKIGEPIGTDNRSTLFLWDYKKLRLIIPENEMISNEKFPDEKFLVYCVKDCGEKSFCYYKNLAASGTYKIHYSDSQFEILRKTE